MGHKILLLAKKTYGDFDCLIETPMFASFDRNVLQEKVNELNAKRTQYEKNNCVRYVILSESIKMI